MEIDYGQGWLFGRPGEAWPRDVDPRPGARRAARRPAAGSSATSSAPARRATPARRSSTTSPAAGLLPTIYLAQDGRLRCQAARGVWQVHDGLPATHRRRRPRLPHRRAGRARRRRGRPWTTCRRSPACAPRSAQPLRAAGQVVGVLDVESLTAIDAADRGRDRALRRAAVGAAGGRRRASAPPRPPSAWPAPRRGWPPPRTRRASCARRSPPRWSSRATSPASSPWPTATARCTRTSPRARSASPSRQLALGGAGRDGLLGRRRHLDLHRRRHRGPRLRRPRGPAPRRRRLADRAAPGRRRRAPRPDHRRRPREPPARLRGRRAARAARAAGRQRPAPGLDDLPAARARLARSADRAARLAAAAAGPHARS